MVVDDGLKDWMVWPEYINGVKPFCFARNANIGIQAVAPDDVILLNDDALLRSPGGFSGLELVSKANPEYGVIASTVDGVGNPNQQPRNRLIHPLLRDEPRMVCFVCVYIPRTTIDNHKIGLLDERYTGYGLDDDDYCFSVREAGLKLGIWDGCFVNHSTLTSSYRGHGVPASFQENMKLFIEKRGTDNWGKKREESEFSHLFPGGTVFL
jgi:GT2 family glycosyltransferase